MTNQQINALIAALSTLVNTNKPKASAHKPQSSYKPKNNFTPKGKILSDGKTDRQLRNDVAVAKAFKKAGFTVVPRVDALTYKGWLSKGMRVIPGQHGIYVKGVGTLFHSGQVATDVQPSKAAMAAETASLLSFPA